MDSDTPLDLREVFARPWSGEATIRRPWWLRWVPLLPTRFDFRTEITSDAAGVLVHDTQTFPNGRVWQRTMRAEVVAPGRWRISAPDMPGGAGITVGSDGYEFTPYTIWAPTLAGLKLPLRCTDKVRFENDASLTDTIELRFLGIPVGTITMRLQRT